MALNNSTMVNNTYEDIADFFQQKIFAIPQTFRLLFNAMRMKHSTYSLSRCNFTGKNGYYLSELLSYAAVTYYLVPTALIIIIVGSCLLPRQKSNCCCSTRCGVFYPFDFLANSNKKFMLCAVFVVYGDILFFSLVDNSSDVETLRYLTREYRIAFQFYRILQMFVLGTAVYPLVAGLTHDHNLIRIFSAIQAWLFLAFYMARYFLVCICDESKGIREILLPLPTLGALIGISVYYPYVIIRKFMNKPVVSEIENAAVYVKSLLYCHRNKKFSNLSAREKVETKLKEITRLRIAGFSYPPLFLATVTCMCFIVFQLMMYFLNALINVRNKLSATVRFLTINDSLGSLLSKLGKLLKVRNPDLNQIAEIEDRCLLAFYYLQDGVMICGIAGLIVATIYVYFTIAQIVLQFRKKQLECLKETKSTINIEAAKTDPKSGFLGFVFYAGYQTAFIVGGFTLNYVILVLLFLVIAYGIVFPLYFGLGFFYLRIMKTFLPPMVVSFLVIRIHYLMAHFVFTDRNKTFRVTNRQWFFVYMHYMFFMNFLLGVFSLTFRILKSFVAFLILIARMDQLVMPKSFKMLDSPYFYYLRFIYVSVLHSSPILLTFVEFLSSPCHHKTSKQGDNVSIEMENSKMVDKISIHSNRMKNNRPSIRWHLAYTLINNPGLQIYRKQIIEQRKKRLQKNDEDPVENDAESDALNSVRQRLISLCAKQK